MAFLQIKNSLFKLFFGGSFSCALVSVALAQAADGSGNRTRSSPEQVLVIGRKNSDFTEITEETQKLVDMPGALGDPLGAVFSLPGVYTAGEGGAPAVRGSSPDDNLFIVDFLPAGYVFHVFTNSVFSENIIQDFQLYSAGFGPQYSDATGAVFDITLRDPKNQPLKTIIDFSMLRSGIFLEGGVSENSAFYLSMRKSLIHLFVDKNKESDGVRMKQPPQDDDYQFKYKWSVNSNNALTLAANGASDLAEAGYDNSSDAALANPDFAGDAKISNRYKSQSLLWDYLGDSGDKLKLGIENMRQDVNAHWGEGYFDNEYLQQQLVKSQYDLPLGTSHIAHIGGEISRNEHGVDYDQILFVCNEFDPNCGDERRGRIADQSTIKETSRAFFVGDSWQIIDSLTVDLGTQYQTNSYTDEKFINPRAALNWRFAERWTATLKGGRYNRFPDLDAVTPKIGNPDLKSPRAKHIAAGLKQELEDGWSWNAEVYYKKLDDLPLALDTNQPDAARLYSNDMEGRAYGVDLLVNKKITDKWYGWFALSLARSERTNERTGATHEYRLDTPVVANWVLNYQVTPRLDAGLRLSMHSGRATTPIVGLKDNPDFPGHVQPVYGEPFSQRLPIYGRLDLRLKYNLILAGHDSALILDIINALNRRNVDDRQLDYKRSQEDRNLHLQDEVGMGIFPALTLRMTF